MNNNLVEQAVKDGVRLAVYYDVDPENPRTAWDELTKMFCMHKRYRLGDEHPYKESMFSGWDEFEARLMEDYDIAIIAPLYMYDHSAVHLKIGSFYGLLPGGHYEFDSGQVGFIFVTKKDFEQYQGYKETVAPSYWPSFEARAREQVMEIMKAEVEVYDNYLNGSVYSYVLERLGTCPCCGASKNELISSCGGFYGYNHKKNGLMESLPDEYKGLVDLLRAPGRTS